MDPRLTIHDGGWAAVGDDNPKGLNYFSKGIGEEFGLFENGVAGFLLHIRGILSYLIEK